MNIYKLTRKTSWDYDDYDSLVVFAKNEDSAKRIHPHTVSLDEFMSKNPTLTQTDAEVLNRHQNLALFAKDHNCRGWVTNFDDIEVTFLGCNPAQLTEGVILTSFNAG